MEEQGCHATKTIIISNAETRHHYLLKTTFSLIRNRTKYIHFLPENCQILVTNIKWQFCCHTDFCKNPISKVRLKCRQLCLRNKIIILIAPRSRKILKDLKRSESESKMSGLIKVTLRD